MNKNKLLLILCLGSLVFSIGIIGYCIIENWSFSDAVYMTVITLTTTGYREVHKLSKDGQHFTVFLLIFGVGAITYSFTQVVNSIVSIDFVNRKRKKMEEKIKKMKNHVVVCGFGRMGKIICKELQKSSLEIVIIERAPNLIEDLKKSQYLWIDGDAASDENLIKAGIKAAKVIVSVIDSDSDGVFISLAAGH